MIHESYMTLKFQRLSGSFSGTWLHTFISVLSLDYFQASSIGHMAQGLKYLSSGSL